MRFYTNFRDLSFFVDLFFDSPVRGILILCLAVVFVLVVSIIYKKSRR